jgi:hypothetical protein
VSLLEIVNVHQLLAVSNHSLHDGRVRELVHALPPFWVFFAHQDLVAVFFNHAIERLVLQSVVPWRQRKIRSSSPQFGLQLIKIPPKDKKSFLEPVKDFFVIFQTDITLAVSATSHGRTHSEAVIFSKPSASLLPTMTRSC